MKKFDVELLKQILNNKIEFYKGRINIYENDDFDYNSVKNIIDYYNDLIKEVTSILDLIEIIEERG